LEQAFNGDKERSWRHDRDSRLFQLWQGQEVQVSQMR